MHTYGDKSLNRYQSDTRVGRIGPRHAYRRRLVCADALSGPRNGRPCSQWVHARSCAIPQKTRDPHLKDLVRLNLVRLENLGLALLGRLLNAHNPPTELGIPLLLSVAGPLRCLDTDRSYTPNSVGVPLAGWTRRAPSQTGASNCGEASVKGSLMALRIVVDVLGSMVCLVCLCRF